MRELLPSVQKIQQELTQCYKKLNQIQNKCKHDEKDCVYNVNRYESFIGNVYITTRYRCNRCNKFWTQSGNYQYGLEVENI